ncbi:MAG: DUF1553 domain-containing protein [Verrucomicrobia bacterium]|nr:DUF1553 domain-containing protein [Verrucomicrobiota bacterium]
MARLNADRRVRSQAIPFARTRTFAVLAASLASLHAATDFDRDIKPIFSEHCYSCHGPEKHKGGLRLDKKADALKGSDSGAVIVPNKSTDSLLFKNVSGANPDSIMPPKGEPLTAAQVALIKAWIDEGAPWPDELADGEKTRSTHWSFQPVKRPEVPAVKDKRWTRNPIDNFVLARLEQEKIKPSPEADRITLIRRLSLDLLGLPPTPEEVKAFLNDKKPGAYERLVDRLLASPHFGERWGRHWLDLARYADSDGYEKDSPRPYAYLYRDWVIEAINRDLPFDQFTIEQLAGDLLPNATKEQQIATGFHRQTLINKEGGVDPEEFRNKAVVDRVNTSGAVWLGLTVGCAECHSHKYDPLTQREFYQLFAFFNNADDQELPAPTPEELGKYEAAKKTWDAAQSRLQKSYDEYVRDALPSKQGEWEAGGKLDLAVWSVLEPRIVASANGATLATLSDHSVAAAGVNPLVETYTVETTAPLHDITGIRVEVLPDDKGQSGPGRVGHGNFVLTEFNVKVLSSNGAEPRLVLLTNATADFSQKDWDVAGAMDGKDKTGWAIAPQAKQRHVAVFECAEPLKLAADDKLVFNLDQQVGNQHTIARFRLSATASPSPKATLAGDAVAVAWTTTPDKRTPEQKAVLADYFRDEVDPEAKKLRKPVEDHAKKAPGYPETKAAILTERAKPRQTHVHLRGDFLRPGEPVEPATPAVLHAFKPRAEKPDRLDLARWLVDEGNPLTSRVTVNHVWKSLFGRGLVASVNDFGTRGELPSHPELLDWLATEFPRRGWSRKALIKLIVTSSTYRQSANCRPDLIERDPLNTLLARQNRLRLEAETVRDVHLAASGLLSKKIGGPSVRPPLPADIAALGYASSIKWEESKGEDRYRRGMYIFFQRTVPYPMLVTFDVPDSNNTCTRRERSNTPLQALTLWNDPVFFDCARALSQRVAGERSVNARLKRAFELCLARTPSRAELARLRRLYEDQQRLTREHPQSAPAILGLDQKAEPPADAVEQASLVAAARVLMNLDEFITRD